MRGYPIVAERVFGEGHYLRPSFIEPYRCRNVLIEGVTIVGSPMWEILEPKKGIGNRGMRRELFAAMVAWIGERSALLFGSLVMGARYYSGR